MNLSNEKIKELIENPKAKSQLSKAREHSDRLKFHTETVLNKFNLNNAYFNFLRWVDTLIPADKAQRFRDILVAPIPTTELTEIIFNELKKIFDAHNYNDDLIMENDIDKLDFQTYLNQVDLKTIWETIGWEAIKFDIDSVVVIDMPVESEKPEPYLFIINSDNIVDISVDKNNNCEYLIYHTAEKYIAYDSTYMRSFLKDSNGNISITAEVEIEHGLGYCPARMLWTDNLEARNTINKKSPISNNLSDLDWLLYFKIMKKYLDMYASLPIYVSYDFTAPKENDDKKTDSKSDSNKPKKNILMGAGSHFGVPVPVDKDSPDLNVNPIQVIPAEEKSLNFCVKEEIRLEDNIKKSCIGSGDEPVNNQAKNELQVKSSFESKEEVLRNIGQNFANIQTWTVETMGRFRYRDGFISYYVNFGTEHYLKSLNDLYAEYTEARTKGLPEVLLQDIKNQIIYTKYRNNNIEISRKKILEDLDPFPFQSFKDLLEMYKEGLIAKDDLKLKNYFLAFVNQFERENLPITEFGKLLNYPKKIEIINTKLYDYVKSKQESEISNQGL